jgi:hypothetical protein
MTCLVHNSTTSWQVMYGYDSAGFLKGEYQSAAVPQINSIEPLMENGSRDEGSKK